MDLILYTLLFLVCISIFLFLLKNNHLSANSNNSNMSNKTRHKRRAGKNTIKSFRPIVNINNVSDTQHHVKTLDNKSAQKNNPDC